MWSWFLTLLSYFLEAGEGQLLAGKLSPHLLQSWDFLRGSHLLSLDAVFLTSCLQIDIWRVDTWKKNRSSWARRRQWRSEAGDQIIPLHPTCVGPCKASPRLAHLNPAPLLTSEVRSHLYTFTLNKALCWPGHASPSHPGLPDALLGTRNRFLASAQGNFRA